MISLAEKELREKDERLRLALVATGLGTWEMDLVHNRRHWSDETFALHGLTRTQETNDHIELNDQVMHSDDRKRLAELHNELRKGRDNYLFEYRTTLPNGSERWISARGKVLERQSNGPTRIVGVTADITEQKKRRQVQDRQNAQFRLLADALPQLVWVADSRGRVTYYNRRRQLYYQELQVAPSDPQWQPLIHPDDHQITAAAWARALQGGQEYETEHRLRMADGHYHWHLTRATPSLGVDGKVTSWFGTATDIARLKDAEVRIRAGEDRLQLATEAAGMFAWEVDLSTGKIEWAENAPNVIGCSNEEWLQHKTEANFFVHVDDRNRILAEFDSYLKSGSDRFEMAFRGWPPSASTKHWRTAGKFMRNTNGQPERAMGVTQDVTRHAEAAAKVKLLDERLATAEEGAGALVYDWDVQNDKVWRSNSLKVILGWEPHELEPNAAAWHRLMHPDDLSRLSAEKPSGMTDRDDHYITEYRIRHKDGRYRWMIDSGRVFRDDSGTVIRKTGTTLDITMRKQLEMSEKRMAKLIDLSFEPIFVWHPQNGIIEWNQGAELLYGYSRAEALGRLPQDLLQTRYPVPTDQFMEQLNHQFSWSGELQNFDKAGKLVDVESRYQVIQFNSETVVLESSRDIGNRKEWEIRQRLMNRELAHRVKNSFAILQAILRSTLRSTPDPIQFATAFSGRLHSMAAAHDVLTENDWRGAELGALLRHQLAPYVTDQRIKMWGGIVNLGAENAAPFSLIFNELATNAVKYGALSEPKGRIDVSWLIELTPKGEGLLVLTWQERDGPPITKKGERGFGMTLIEKSLAGAIVDMKFKLEGLSCTLTWPIAKSGQQHAPTQ
jgi:PAS domain S-box-containing protein